METQYVEIYEKDVEPCLRVFITFDMFVRLWSNCGIWAHNYMEVVKQFQPDFWLAYKIALIC